MRKMTKSSIRASSDDDLCININGSSVELETSALGNLREGNLSFYSVAISFLKFLQWFFGILLCGPVQRVWWPPIFSSSPRYVPNKKPKTSRIFVIDSASSCDKILRSYCSNYPFKMNFLGVDCEWVNRKGQANAPVALLQLATPLCDCFLIRLCKMEGRMPQSVKELLEDKAILKFGVGIQDDVKRLSGMFGVKVLGCVDLRQVMQRCRLDEAGQQRNQKMSLDALAKRVLGVTMDKSWRIRCSNWEAQQFNTCQIEYAMNDALVASHIFLRLVKSKGEEGTADRTAFVSENGSSVEKEGLETQNGSLSFGVACVDDKASKQESWSKKCAADNIRPSSTVNLLESEKDEEGDNDSLSFEHVYVDDESGKQTESCLISETDNNKSDSAVNLSDSHLTGSSQISSFFLTEREPNIALSNENINIFEPDVKEDSEVFLESDNQGNSSDCVLLEGRESLLGEKDDDSRIDGEGFMVSVDAAELASGCYEVTADLKKLELEEAEGYLSKEDVINLLENPLFSQRASSLCQGVVDLAFKVKKKKATAKEKDNIKEYICEKNNRKPYKRMSPRKSPLYMNCMLAAPDGSRLCTLDRKKADWYIQKGIGKLTCLDPYTVQLNFEPSGRPGVEDSYYLNFKDNVCVVCGSDQSYMRKNIVPHDYRRYFPLVMKDHHSHDILLMCPECHYLSNYYDDRLRKELASKYDAPLGNATVARLVEDPELRKVKSAAKALNYAGDKLPEDRHQELSLIVQKFFKASVLTPDMISQAVTMETRKENANFVSHGLEVVRRVREEGKLLEFEKMWRKHFVDTMRPQYLPPLWSVDHRHEGLKEKLQDCEEF